MRKYAFLLSLFVLVLGASVAPAQPMQGTYTIKTSGGDFESFNEALDAMLLRGIAGDITFCVYPGVYDERLYIASPDNGSYKVVFQGLDTLGVPTGAVLNAGGQNHAVELRNTKRFEFRHLGVTGFNIWGFALDYTGVYLGVDSCVIADCDISGPNGIYIHFGSHGNRIERNRINASSTYGIRLWCIGTRNSHTYIANNMVASAVNPLYLYNHQDSEVHYNTFYSRGAYNAYYDYHGYGGTYRNNIYHNSGDGHAWVKWYGDNLSGFSDHNCFYSSTGYTYVIYNSSYGGGLTLAQWQANGFDLNSINQDPLVVADTNLHLQDGSPCIGAGTPITGITTDIDGDSRSAIAPTIGADEVMGDITVSGIVTPAAMVPIGSPFTPQAAVGLATGPASTFRVGMEIRKAGDLLYSGVSDLVTLGAGEADTVDLAPECTLFVTGTDYTATAWHLSTPDRNPANDTAAATFAVGNPDLGVKMIQAPNGRVDTMATVIPQARLRNYGDVEVGGKAWFRMWDPSDGLAYEESVDVAAIVPNHEESVTFPAYNVGNVLGDWTSRCSVYVAGDVDPENDTLSDGFEVQPVVIWPSGWVEMQPMPAAPSGQPVKDGAWLEVMDDNVYAAKGNKVGDFYYYDVMMDSWVDRAPVPQGVEGKLPRKGCAVTSDGDRYLYMTKGNNTLAFWLYDALADTWGVLPEVPLGPNNKKVKGGTDLAYVSVRQDTDYVYLMKGYKREFYRYNVEARRWDTLADLPYGYKEKWDKGSWLVGEGGRGRNQLIYAHQSKYYNKTTEHHYMYQYETDADSWYTTALKGMPIWGLHSGKLRKKKSKDGGMAAYFDDEIYALKGGNTQQFYKYTVLADSWTELDTMPTYSPTTGKRRRVKYGGDIVHWGDGAFFALKGNKTLEFWRYVVWPLPAVPGRSGVLAERAGSMPVGLTLAPNPLAKGRATLRYSLPKAGAANISVFDVTGRSVLSRSVSATRSGAVSLNVGELAAGTYLVRLEAEGFTGTQKLVVQR